MGYRLDGIKIVIVAMLAIIITAMMAYAEGNYVQDGINAYNSMAESGRQDRQHQSDLETQKRNIEIQNRNFEILQQTHAREQERHNLEMQVLQQQVDRTKALQRERDPIERFHKDHPEYDKDPALLKRLISISLNLQDMPKNKDKSHLEVLTAAHEEILKQVNQKKANDFWVKEQSLFLKIYPQYKQDQFLWDTLNGVVIRLANSPEYQNKSGMDILLAANKEVLDRTASKEEMKQRRKNKGRK